MTHRWLDIDDVPRAVILDLNAQTVAKAKLNRIAPPMTEEERARFAGPARRNRGDN